MNALQRPLYRTLIRLLWPLGLWLARKQDPSRWRERLGHYPPALPQRPIWIHAASVGEAKAAALLIEALRAQGENGPFLVTTTTRTGGDTIRAELGPGDIQLYAPLDIDFAIRRALRRIQPRALVVMEVEIWPNLWAACTRRDIPIILANARLSESSLTRYRNKLPTVWRQTLQRAALILAQSEAVAARFRQLGVDEARLRICGNLKYSLNIGTEVTTAGQQLRDQLGPTRPIWLAASTHPGEEEIALACHRQLLSHHPDLLLVLVPRHPQRFDAVAELCAASGLSYQRRSADKEAAVGPVTQLYLADTLGELLALFCATDLCWVAGSFADVGGHNILEPAACGCPVIVGPDMRNFETITEQFRHAGALIQVQNQAGLATALAAVLDQPKQAAELAAAAAAQLTTLAKSAAEQATEIRQQLH